MPLFRSRMGVHRARARAVGRFFVAMAIVTFVFIVVIAVHYLTGWW